MSNNLTAGGHPAGRSGAFASLHTPNYRRYFAAQLASLVGTWMQGIALPWLVYEQTGAGSTLGVVVAVQSAPVLLLAPYGGVVVDRIDTRRLLMLTQAAQGGLALVLGVLTLAGAVRIWMIVPIALGSGLAQAFDNPARQSIVMELVGPADLRNAISLNSVTINVARAVGPAIAAGVIATVGVGDCFLANAASFGCVIFVLATLNRAAMRTVEPQPRGRGQLRLGLAYVRRTPQLYTPLIMMALVGTLSYNYPVTLLLLARQSFHGGATTYSALTIALGSGAVVSGLAVAARAKTGLAACALATAEYGATTLLAAFAPNLPVELFALFISGLGYVAFNSIGNSTLQLACEPAMRGRVMGLWSVAFQGSTVIGSPVAGFVGQELGARWALALGGLAALAATAVCVVSARLAAVRPARTAAPLAELSGIGEQEHA
ncbi:MAG TPA: MFS transporter [Trebonia sp.]|nr:MFS transporter [Trebonia sp.]